MWKYTACGWMCRIGEMATLSLSKQPCWLGLMHGNADMVAPLTTADNFSLAPVVLFTHNRLQRSSVISLRSEAEIPWQKVVVAHLCLHKLIYSQVEVFKKNPNNKALSDLSTRDLQIGINHVVLTPQSSIYVCIIKGVTLPSSLSYFCKFVVQETTSEVFGWRYLKW